MIGCYVEGFSENNDFCIGIPFEINNTFWAPLAKMIYEKEIKGYDFDIIYKDFGGEVKIPVDKLEEHLRYYEILEDNLEELIKIVPLPEKIGNFDGYYYDGFISTTTFSPEHPVNDEIYGERKFTKEDMLLLIDLIKKKILEAKEKGEALIFSGD